MLLWLTQWLAQFDPAFGVAQYLTLRAILSVLTALLITLWVGPIMIRRLGIRQIRQTVRDYGPEAHLSKSGTPTMGGALILVGIALSCLLWGNLTNHYLWVVLLVTLGLGAVGWVDDWRKVVNKDPEGLPARWKYLWQSLIGFTAAVFFVRHGECPRANSVTDSFLQRRRV